MKLEYCISWFWGNRMTNNPISIDEARRRHGTREGYTVAVGGFDRPSAMIELVKTMVAVTFFDEMLRERLTYQFSERPGKRLFFSMASKRIYRPATREMVEYMHAGRADPKHKWGQFFAETDWVLDGRSLVFKEDGTIYRSFSRHGDGRQIEEIAPPFDNSHNWEKYPEFGEYDHLLKEDRGLPWWDTFYF